MRVSIGCQRWSSWHYVAETFPRNIRALVIHVVYAVLDFPKQQVITRDNAMISLDALLNYKVSFHLDASTSTTLSVRPFTDHQRQDHAL